MLLALFVCCLPIEAAPEPTGAVTLDVPFLPQTEALCGGAAAAMVFRYWGDTHASVRQFEPLVDRKAGGIADDVLVSAIADRQWTVEKSSGSIDLLRRQLTAKQPPIILIQVGPQRYHYVVVVGVAEDAVFVHDPTWGPSRRLRVSDLLKAWAPTGYWLLRVTRSGPIAPETTVRQPSGSPERTPNACDAPLNAALDEIATSGLDHADVLLWSVADRCPDDGRPLRELAGVRFAQRRWEDAGSLAAQALERDGSDPYALDVLASSRFMMNDAVGALRAWNREGRPRLDSTRITGLTRMRYASLSKALGLEPDTTLTPSDFELARRRLESMPDVASSRLSLRPGEDGFAVVDVAVAERETLPRSPLVASAVAARAAIDREVGLHVPGGMGQGEAWDVAWRWWARRPRVSVGFATPVVRGPGGVWRVGLSWDAQTYGAVGSDAREERLRGETGFSTWLAPNLRVSTTIGLDRWRQIDGARDRRASFGAAVERRFLHDRVAAMLSLDRWMGSGKAPGFSRYGADIATISSRDVRPFVWLARAGASSATGTAPLALWNGAGDGRARVPLLRAHALLHDGRIDGPVFGRRVAFATTEVHHWLARPSIARIAVAAFADAASAAGRLEGSDGRPSQVDAGVGLRVRVPGASGTLRVDYAHGIVDGADAWSVGWLIE